MWSVENIKTGTKVYFIVNKSYLVGRNDASKVRILNDPSVSRSHAELKVIRDDLDENASTILTIQDLGSKYGSQVNGADIPKNKIINLKDNDHIKFGVYQSNYKVHCTSLKVAFSCISNNLKSAEKIIRNIGGQVVSSWGLDVNYLVMSEIKQSVKFFCCLITSKPVVTIEYFLKLHDEVIRKEDFPSPLEYLPPITDSILLKYNINFNDSDRHKLFSKKYFVFLFENQVKEMEQLIHLASGEILIIKENHLFDKEMLYKPETIVIEPIEEEKSCNLYQEIKKTLYKHKRSAIPASHIGLAVAVNSLKEFCNPESYFKSHISNIQERSFKESSEVYVKETPEEYQTNLHNFHFEDEIKNDHSCAFSSKEQPAVDFIQETPEENQGICSLSFESLGEENSGFPSRLPKNPVAEPLENLKWSLSKTSTQKTTLLKNNNPETESLATKNLSPIQIKVEPEIFSCEDEYNKATYSFAEKVDKSIGKKSKPLSVSPSKHDDKKRTLSFEEDSEYHGPKIQVHVKFVNLVHRKTMPYNEGSRNNSNSNSVKNFKRFKKAAYKGDNSFPKIIGGSDLVPHEKLAYLKYKIQGKEYDSDD